MRSARLRLRVVDDVPDRLRPGRLYASIGHGTALHLCPCGCGTEVVTPLDRGGWTLVRLGRRFSLTPSVRARGGCRSHYWIRDGRVEWARDASTGAAPTATGVRRLVQAVLRALGRVER